MKSRFKIYAPDTKVSYSVNSWVYGSASVSLIIGLVCKYLGGNLLADISNMLLMLSIGILFFVGAGLKLTQHSIYQPLNGNLDHELVLSKYGIKIGDGLYTIEDIKSISIRSNDYSGRRLYRCKGDFNPSKSNGTNNTITLKLVNGGHSVTRFQQRVENELILAKDVLVEYYRKERLSFLALTKLLNLSNYNAIQKFKDEIGETTKLPCR